MIDLHASRQTMLFTVHFILTPCHIQANFLTMINHPAKRYEFSYLVCAVCLIDIFWDQGRYKTEKGCAIILECLSQSGIKIMCSSYFGNGFLDGAIHIQIDLKSLLFRSICGKLKIKHDMKKWSGIKTRARSKVYSVEEFCTQYKMIK